MKAEQIGRKAGHTWRRRAVGGWITTDGRWVIRGPIMGKPMYWLYGPNDYGDYRRNCRYTPTGRYDDCVSFTSVAAAKKFVKGL